MDWSVTASDQIHPISLVVGAVIGYTAGCVRRTMIYAKRMKVEVHEIHRELIRLEGKIDDHFGNGEDDGEVPG